MTAITLGLGARNLRDTDYFSKSDPFVVISKPSLSGSFEKIRMSETKKNTLNPDWKDFYFKMEEVCNGDPTMNIKFEVWDDDGRQGLDGKDKLLGQGFWSLKMLESAYNVHSKLPLMDGKNKKNRGSIVVRTFKYHNLPGQQTQSSGYNSGYSSQYSVGHPPVGQGGYPSSGAPTGYPPAGAPGGYPLAGAPSRPPTAGAPSGYPSAGAPSSGGYPPASSGGYPAPSSGGYPPSASGGYPVSSSGMVSGQSSNRYPSSPGHGSGYPATNSSGYPPSNTGGYPPNSGYPQGGGAGGYPPNNASGYPPNNNPGYPSNVGGGGLFPDSRLPPGPGYH